MNKLTDEGKAGVICFVFLGTIILLTFTGHEMVAISLIFAVCAIIFAVAAMSIYRSERAEKRKKAKQREKIRRDFAVAMERENWENRVWEMSHKD